MESSLLTSRQSETTIKQNLCPCLISALSPTVSKGGGRDFYEFLQENSIKKTYAIFFCLVVLLKP